jgi:hypothetical protein
VEVQAAPAVDWASAPISTVSESESGMERTYQQTGVLLQRALELSPEGEAAQVFDVTVGPRKG